MKVIQSTRVAIAVIVLVTGTAATVSAQTRPDRVRMGQNQHEERGMRASDRGIVALVRRLELDDRQIAAVRRALTARETGEANGWAVARVLQRELTDAQKTRLFAQAQRSAAFARGVRSTDRAGRAESVAPGVRGRMDVRIRNRVQDRVARNVDLRARNVERERAIRGRQTPGMNGIVQRRASAMADALNLTEAQRETIRIHRALRVLRGANVPATRR